MPAARWLPLTATTALVALLGCAAEKPAARGDVAAAARAGALEAQLMAETYRQMGSALGRAMDGAPRSPCGADAGTADREQTFTTDTLDCRAEARPCTARDPDAGVVLTCPPGHYCRRTVTTEDWKCN